MAGGGRRRWPQRLDERPHRLVGVLAAARNSSSRRSADGFDLLLAAACAVRCRVGSTICRPRFVPWLAFAEQKLAEVVTLTQAVNEGEAAIATELDGQPGGAGGGGRFAAAAQHGGARAAGRLAAGRRSARPTVCRAGGEPGRRLGLPLLPTTTIGSFPQTTEIRNVRKEADEGRLTTDDLRAVSGRANRRRHRRQEALGLDVLVHGEYGAQRHGPVFRRAT